MTPDEAMARLQAREAAATQPSGLTVAQVDELRAKIARLESENESLKQSLARARPVPVGESDVQPSATTRPDGYTDTQWLLAKTILDYRVEVLKKLREAQSAAANAQGRTYFDGPGFLHTNKWIYVPPDPAIQQRVEDLTKIARRQRAGELIVPDLFVDDLKVGEIGEIAYSPGTLGPTDLHKVAFHVAEVVDRTDILGSMFNQDIWITGIRTTGIVDDREIELNGIFFVRGTKTYPTNSGAQRTVLLMEPVDDSNIKEAVDFLQSAGGKPASAPGGSP